MQASVTGISAIRNTPDVSPVLPACGIKVWVRGRLAVHTATRTPLRGPTAVQGRALTLQGEPVSASSVTARRLAAVAVASAAAVGAFVPSASAADHDLRGRNARVEISDVQSDTWGRQDRSNRSLNREWVEITNNTRRDVNLSGWTLSDRDGHTYTFHHYRLGAHATVRVHTGIGHDTRTDLFQDRCHYAWDNHSDTAILRNDHGRTIDIASWGRRHR